MTDATALRKAKEHWEKYEITLKKAARHDPYWKNGRCEILGTVTQGPLRWAVMSLAMGNTWEHAFIDAGVTP